MDGNTNTVTDGRYVPICTTLAMPLLPWLVDRCCELCTESESL